MDGHSAETAKTTDTLSQASADDRLARDFRGFGPLGIVTAVMIVFTANLVFSNMVTVPVGAVLALVWVRLSHTPWREIGYVRPKSWVVAVAGGIAIGVAFKFLMKAIVLPLFGAGPINPAYHFLTGNRELLPRAVWVMVVAGFAEETVFRGFIFERLGKLLGSSARAKATIVLITSTLFGLAHFHDQGLAGAEQATIVGLVFGSIFAFTGTIFMVMVAHSAFDLTALAIIYLDLESRVAHSVFR
jgi:membrane protease YdiL (CAAX protease family)